MRFRKKRGGSRKAKAIPIAVGAPLAYTAYRSYKNAISGNWDNVVEDFTGYNPEQKKFVVGSLVRTYVPIGAGIVVHKLANSSGANNFVRRMTMGYLSI